MEVEQALWRLGLVGQGPGGLRQWPWRLALPRKHFYFTVTTNYSEDQEKVQNRTPPPPQPNHQQKQPLTIFFLNVQLMAGWLYIIKQAAGDVPGETTPAKTHSLNTMFQETITHGVPGEEHPEEGLQLLSLCLFCPGGLWFSCRKQECAGPGAPASFIHPGSMSWF